MARTGKTAQRKTAHRSSDSVNATDAQNNFGEVLARVARVGRVFITRYRRREAVVLSIAEYEALVGEEPVDLVALEQEFESAMANMQSQKQHAAVDALFSSTPTALGRAAADTARRRS